MMGYFSRWVDWETSSMLDEIESKSVHKDKEGDQYRKKKYDTGWSKASWEYK